MTTENSLKIVESEIIKNNSQNGKQKGFKKIPEQQLKELIDSFIEIELNKPFQIIRETISRIGVLKNGVLYQTAHILHKKGKYYIVHFKQLFSLDGKYSTIQKEDYSRLYKVVYLLQKWQLVKIVRKEDEEKAAQNAEIHVNIAKKEDVKEGKIQLQKKYNL